MTAQTHHQHPLSVLVADYIGTVRELGSLYRKVFGREGKNMELDAGDEDRAELLLNQLEETDLLLRAAFQAMPDHNGELAREIQNFLNLEGNLRHISPKDLERFLAQADTRMQNIDRLIRQIDPG